MVIDTVVVGAGAMGSATSFFRSEHNSVLLLEQFNFLHDEGSSHGQSRIIRKTYQADYYSLMMHEAYSLWDKIQTLSGSTLMINTGGLNIGKRNDANLQMTLKTCEKLDMEHEVFHGSEITTRFPAYSVEDDHLAIYQAETGIINATKSLQTLQELARNNGAELNDHEEVVSINYSSDPIKITTNKATYKCKKLVITPGSWINSMLEKLDLRVKVNIWNQTLAFWKVDNKNYDNFKAEKFPPFIYWEKDNDNYGFPIHEKHNYVKIAAHQNPIIEKTDFHDSQNLPNQELLDYLENFVSTNIVGLNTVPKYIDNCYYSMTKNEDFIIDYHPENSNIVIAGGFSGHGFKFTPLVGRIINDMLDGKDPGYNMSKFNISNFQ